MYTTTWRQNRIFTPYFGKPLLFWQSESAVVCGKHQNLCAEINYAACQHLGIKAARRVSGGGTVYHDLGNLNFAYIQDLGTTLDKAVNYKRFLEPIRQALSTLGIESTYSQRDDLLYQGLKFSGNAQHIFQQQKRVLHHGTLLLNANIHNLGKALKTDGNYQDKAVKSNRSEVTNLGDHHPTLTDIPNTIDQLSQALIPCSRQKHPPSPQKSTKPSSPCAMKNSVQTNGFLAIPPTTNTNARSPLTTIATT